MINITDKTLCSGCTACEAVCPRSAIIMKPDALGFMYPKLDITKCVDCGLCDKVCNFKEAPIRPDGFPETYLMQHIKPTEVLKSKSGAAFVALSDEILRDNGVVYGAQLNSEHLVVHSSANTPEERDKFRGSKYIQSDLRGVFIKIKEDLAANKKVLFTGTPCQVAGLKAFIGNKLSKNLLLVDILCHGVASPAVWKDYITSLENKIGKKLLRCIPRNPQFGWYNNVDTFIFEDGSQYNSDYFTGYVYHKWITQRWSCSICPFTSLNRISDITIGDAWGYGRVAPEFDKENLGCSIVLINTEKGRELFKSASENMRTMQVDINEMMQPVMKNPTAFHPKRQKFEKTYSKHGFKYAKMIYLNAIYSNIKNSVWHFLLWLKHSIFG